MTTAEVLNGEHLFMILLFVVLFGFVLVNMIILGLMFKLYTEILKEKSQRDRVKEPKDLSLKPYPYSLSELSRMHASAGNIRELAKLVQNGQDAVVLRAAAKEFDEIVSFVESAHPRAG